MRRMGWCLAFAGLAACGDGGGWRGAVDPGETVTATVALPATPATALEARLVPLADPVGGILPLPAGAALLATAGGPYEVQPPPGGAVAMRVEAVGGDPAATGAVAAVAPRWGGTQWLAAAGGLFYRAAGLLLHSPLSRGLDGPPAAVASGPEGDLLVATASTLYWSLSDSLSALSVPGHPGAPRALAAGDGAPVTWALYGDTALAIERDHLDLRATTLSRLGAGRVSGMAAAPDGTLALATERGVLVRGAAGGWTRYTLAASGDAPAGAIAASATAAGQPVFYAAFGAGIWRLAGSEQTVFTVAGADPAAVRALGADRAGRLWLGRRGDVLQVLTEILPEGKTTFADQIVPFIDTYCGSCHGPSGYAPLRFWRYDDFKRQIDRIIAALDGGRMPLGRTLQRAEWAVVQRWKDDGMLP